MKFDTYFILRGLIFGGGGIFERNFVLVNRGTYIQGGLYPRFYDIFLARWAKQGEQFSHIKH